jgi:CubicO group peptidase (beta-lactamase class C family)
MKIKLAHHTIALTCAAACLLTATHVSATPAVRITQLFDELEQANRFSGSVLVASKDKLVFERAIGFADKEKNLLNRPDTAFRTASITKGLTAVLILMAVERGELNLDGTLAEHFPEIKTNLGAGKITLRQLLSHTSGLTDFAPQPEAAETVRESLIRQLENSRLKFVPGSKYDYCNVGYTILGTVLEKATHSSYADLLEKRLFNPAGMSSSYLENKALGKIPRARGHSADGLTPEEELNMNIFLPAGGVVSTAGDLWRFDQALTNEKLLSRAAQQGMNIPVKEAGAYGCQVRTLPAGHKVQIFAGGMPGASTVMVRVNGGEHVVILLANRSSLPVQQIAQQILMVLLTPDSTGSTRVPK